jgi:hypothetical protein
LAEIKTRAWRHGDIVKIDSHIAAADAAGGSLGMIIKRSSDEQQQIFPSFVVYDFYTKEEKDVFVYNLTLVSARAP